MILIIQNGYLGTYISKYLKEEYHIIKSYETDVSRLDLELYSMVIILGGNQSVIKIHTNKSLENVVNLIKKCYDYQKPVFGICLGCQLIAYALGCQIKYSGKLNLGYDTKIFGYDNILRSHNDYIVPNDKITIIEEFDSMPCVIKSSKSNKLIGVQCHPDIPPEYVSVYNSDPVIRKIAEEKKYIIDKNNQTVISLVMSELTKN